jgi:alpha-L-arabinofuranosidase
MSIAPELHPVPRTAPQQPGAQSSARRLNSIKCGVFSASLLLLIPFTAGCQSPARAPSSIHTQSSNSSGPTTIEIATKVIRSDVKRMGMNLSGQSYYDSGQMLRNITFRNPGFEGQIWQTILSCRFVKDNACADTDEWSGWPADFAKGATYEFFYGAAKGQTGTVTTSSVAASSAHQGIWVTFGKLAVAPKVGDFYILRMKIPGSADAGWRTATQGGGTITTEFHDLPPNSPGKQALRLTAAAPGQSAVMTSDVDTWEGRSFLQLKGVYTLNFRAKGLGGSNEINASISRLTKAHGIISYLSRNVPLSNGWKDYTFTFNANEDGTFIGPILVTLEIRNSSALLDDFSLTEAAAPDNPTAFRNAVVNRLRQLHPGVLRYMDNGTNFGSTIDNLIAPPFARERSGFSEGDKLQLEIPIGLHEFLVLCKAINAEPWFVMPAGMTPAEAQHLVEYLAGPVTSGYGSKRAALGQQAPWTSVFPIIHLELGNETWNAGSFAGEGIADPKAYATRVSTIFAATKSSPLYNPAKFDLIMDGWYGVPWWNEQELSIKTYADTIDIAPYTFNPFNDASSTEAIFGPMFAEPEALDSRPTGLVAQNAKVAAKGGVKLSVYEVNLGSTLGKVNQQALDSAVPSVGAGISVADHMLLMLRDDGITNQALFSLPEYLNSFTDPDDPSHHFQVKLWGSVVDMGGQTNRVRPTFEAEELLNSAIEDKMLETSISGANPSWNQPESTNGKIKLDGAHYLQTFAFTNGMQCSLIVFNLSRDSKLPVAFGGSVVPNGKVKISQLTSPHIIDSNEFALTVATTHKTDANFDPTKSLDLPPYSMTVFEWDTSGLHF